MKSLFSSEFCCIIIWQIVVDNSSIGLTDILFTNHAWFSLVDFWMKIFDSPALVPLKRHPRNLWNIAFCSERILILLQCIITFLPRIYVTSSPSYSKKDFHECMWGGDRRDLEGEEKEVWGEGKEDEEKKRGEIEKVKIKLCLFFEIYFSKLIF